MTRVLIDECMTAFAPHIQGLMPDAEVLTVNDIGAGGLSNGDLQAAAIEFGCDKMTTIDTNMPFETEPLLPVATMSLPRTYIPETSIPRFAFEFAKALGVVVQTGYYAVHPEKGGPEYARRLAIAKRIEDGAKGPRRTTNTP